MEGFLGLAVAREPIRDAGLLARRSICITARRERLAVAGADSPRERPCAKSPELLQHWGRAISLERLLSADSAQSFFTAIRARRREGSFFTTLPVWSTRKVAGCVNAELY